MASVEQQAAEQATSGQAAEAPPEIRVENPATGEATAAVSDTTDEKVKSSVVLVKGKKLILRYRPLGLVGVIGPWNYPLTNSFGDCIPALAAGNSVILKPSEITPLTSLLMAEGQRECGIPQHVFQVATGRGATGAALVDEVD